jgi:ABC-type transport system involved in multi-copper enzyme maturation permease subunit
MYFWKCWRCSRARFFYCLIVVILLFGTFTVGTVKVSEVDAMRQNPALAVLRNPSTAAASLFESWGSIFVIIWGFVLGGASLGEEFKDRTADFLLARPRRRRYWVWAGWSIGLAEMVATVLLMGAVTFASLVFLRGNLPTWRPLAMLLPLALNGILVYGLTYLMSVVVRGSQLAISYSIGILALDMLIPAALGHYHLNVNFLYCGINLGKVFVWATKMSGTFPFAALFAWTAVALAFPLAAQLLLERAEV